MPGIYSQFNRNQTNQETYADTCLRSFPIIRMKTFCEHVDVWLLSTKLTHVIPHQQTIVFQLCSQNTHSKTKHLEVSTTSSSLAICPYMKLSFVYNFYLAYYILVQLFKYDTSVVVKPFYVSTQCSKTLDISHDEQERSKNK